MEVKAEFTEVRPYTTHTHSVWPLCYRTTRFYTVCMCTSHLRFALTPREAAAPRKMCSVSPRMLHVKPKPDALTPRPDDFLSPVMCSVAPNYRPIPITPEPPKPDARPKDLLPPVMCSVAPNYPPIEPLQILPPAQVMCSVATPDDFEPAPPEETPEPPPLPVATKVHTLLRTASLSERRGDACSANSREGWRGG